MMEGEIADTLSLEEYLAAGGVVTSPANATPRYRAEVMKVMASFVDSELAGAAGFSDVINQAPGLRERIAAARIVLEKTGNAKIVLDLPGEFGANTARHATSHPRVARLDRDAPVPSCGGIGNKRLMQCLPIWTWAEREA